MHVILFNGLQGGPGPGLQGCLRDLQLNRVSVPLVGGERVVACAAHPCSDYCAHEGECSVRQEARPVCACPTGWRGLL